LFITPKGAREEAQATGVDRTGPSLSFEPTAARHQQAANQHEAIPFNDEHHIIRHARSHHQTCYVTSSDMRHQREANQHEAIPFNDEHHKRNGQPSSTGRAGKAPPRQSTIN